MNLFSRKKKYRRRKALTNEEMNLAKANNDYERGERYKTVINRARIGAVIVGLVAIPVLFVSWCAATYFLAPAELPDNIYVGITAVISFLFGRANFFDKSED